MAQGTWREDPEENTLLQQQYERDQAAPPPLGAGLKHTPIPEENVYKFDQLTPEDYTKATGQEAPVLAPPTGQELVGIGERPLSNYGKPSNEPQQPEPVEPEEDPFQFLKDFWEETGDSDAGKVLEIFGNLAVGIPDYASQKAKEYARETQGSDAHLTAAEISALVVSIAPLLKKAPQLLPHLQKLGVGFPALRHTLKQVIPTLDEAAEFAMDVFNPLADLKPALAGVSVGTFTRSHARGIRLDYEPPTSMQINAQSALGRDPALGGQSGPGESAMARTLWNKETKGIPQSNIRGQRAEMATDYAVTDPGPFIDEAAEGAEFAFQYHHGGDHKLVGDVGLVIGKERQKKVLNILQKKFSIRTGNDRHNMVLMHGGFDHQGLMHKKYYPQISTRRRLEEVTASGEIKGWSDERIAGLMQAAIKDQQEVIIGWGKWKIKAIAKEFPITADMNPKQLRDWVRDNPELVRTAGKGTEPATFDEMRKYGARAGDIRNWNNKWLRTVFGIEFMNEKAAKGLAHEIAPELRRRKTPGSDRPSVQPY